MPTGTAARRHTPATAPIAHKASQWVSVACRALAAGTSANTTARPPMKGSSVRSAASAKRRDSGRRSESCSSRGSAFGKRTSIASIASAMNATVGSTGHWNPGCSR